MATLEHLNLVVTDINPTLTFLSAAFPHWRVRGEGRDEWHGMPRCWVHVGDDETYLTLNDFGRGTQRDLKSDTPGLAHIGFVVSSLEAIKDNLAKAGFTPSHDGNHTAHRRNVYYIDDEGLEFEFTEYLSDEPAKRNEYA